MYLIVYPPVGLQMIGNINVTDHLSEETKLLAISGRVKIICCPTDSTAFFEYVGTNGYRSLKVLLKSDTNGGVS